MCPASRCGTSQAAGPHGDARTGSKSLKRARELFAENWFSRSRLVDRLPLPVLRPARIPGYPRSATLSGGFERGSPVDLPLRHQRPDDARHPVGQRHRDDHPRLARQHPGEPRIVRPAAPDRPANNRHGTRDQQQPKIALAHLRYLAQPRLAAGRVLARYEAEPGREVAARRSSASRFFIAQTPTRVPADTGNRAPSSAEPEGGRAPRGPVETRTPERAWRAGSRRRGWPRRACPRSPRRTMPRPAHGRWRRAGAARSAASGDCAGRCRRT